MPQAFGLEMDGQSLIWDWEWQGLEEVAEEGLRHVVIGLRHAVRPVSVKVHTKLDGTAILTRWLEVTNTGAQPAALSAVASWSGVLQKTNRWRSHLGDGGGALYSIGYFANSHWGNEGDFQWFDLPEAGYRVDGRYRRDRHRHPMVVVRNNATGEHFIWQLAGTGGYSFEFDLDADAGTMDQAARLWFRAGPDAPAPLRILAPGETVTTPEVHLGAVFGDFDATIQSMHDHLRKSVFIPQPRGRGGWVESGIGPEIEITAEDVVHAIDVAAEFGAEVFFVDASWYARPHGNWWSTVGDWDVNLERFPEGLTPFRERAHAKGMLWGAVDGCRASGRGEQGPRRASGLAGRRVRWAEESRRPAGPDEPRGGRVDGRADRPRHRGERAGVLPARPQHAPGRGPADAAGGLRGERVLPLLRGAVCDLRPAAGALPDVIFENCAGGGGRTDLGMVRRFSHTWVTDWQIAPRSFAITNGMSMALPPEYVDRLLGGQAGHTAAELDFQWRLLLFVRPTIGFPKPRGAEWNPVMLARMKRFVSLYKEFVRPFMNTGRIYHHTPCVTNPEPRGWGVLELASRDRTRAVCGLFQLASPTEPEYLLRLRGLDRSRRYKVTFDNTGQTCEVEGLVLMNQGLAIRLEGALTSELLVIEAE
jgi:alpha-galactosidase